jgi:hypothetical protein
LSTARIGLPATTPVRDRESAGGAGDENTEAAPVRWQTTAQVNSMARLPGTHPFPTT